MIGSSRVKLNIILNQAQLLVISNSISDLRRRISGVAFHLDILHRLGMTLKIPQKWHMCGSSRRVIGNSPFQSIPTPKSIVHTISDATLCSVWPRAVKTINVSLI